MGGWCLVCHIHSSSRARVGLWLTSTSCLRPSLRRWPGGSSAPTPPSENSVSSSGWEKLRSSGPMLPCPSSSSCTSWYVVLSSSGSCSGVYVWHLLSGLSAIHHCPHASWWHTLASTAHCSVSDSGIVSAFIWKSLQPYYYVCISYCCHC